MNSQLPELCYREPTPEKSARLRRWIGEWESRALTTESPTEKVMESGSGDRPGLKSQIDPYDTAAENFEPGCVRLFSANLLSHCDRPVYALILEAWNPDDRLVALFSPFSEPGTTTEYLTGREEYPLKVLSCWNAVTLSLEDLGKGWMATRFETEELEEARAVFRHAITGETLPDELEKRTGPPVIHPLDPRIEYQEEEVRILAPLFLTSLDAESGPNRASSPTPLVLRRSPAGKGLRDACYLPLAASKYGERRTPGIVFRGSFLHFQSRLGAGIEAAEKDTFVGKLLVGPSSGTSIQWDVEGTVAAKQEGALVALIDPKENTVIIIGEIEDGTVVIPMESMTSEVREEDLDQMVLVVFDPTDE